MGSFLFVTFYLDKQRKSKVIVMSFDNCFYVRFKSFDLYSSFFFLKKRKKQRKFKTKKICLSRKAGASRFFVGPARRMNHKIKKLK